MTEGAGRLFCHLGREISPLRSAAVEMTGMGGFFYNLRPKGATITLGPKGRRSLSEANITRRRQAATTFGPEGRQPSPLNSLNLMNPLNPHTEGVSTGARQHRHLERRYVPVWETDGNRSDDTLSREISHSNAARTIRGGDFSTPLRFGRNDDRGSASTVISSGGFMRRLSRGV